MKKVVIMDERDFAKLATECNHIESAVSLAKDAIDNPGCLQESLNSIARHIATVQAVLNKKDD